MCVREYICMYLGVYRPSLVAQTVKKPPAKQETWVRSLGKTSWRRKWLPTSASCLENSVDRGAWGATVPGVAKSQTQLSDWVTGRTQVPKPSPQPGEEEGQQFLAEWTNEPVCDPVPIWVFTGFLPCAAFHPKLKNSDSLQVYLLPRPKKISRQYFISFPNLFHFFPSNLYNYSS